MLLKLAVFIVLGAIVNVAVAWGLVLSIWSFSGVVPSYTQTAFPHEEQWLRRMGWVRDYRPDGTTGKIMVMRFQDLGKPSLQLFIFEEELPPYDLVGGNHGARYPAKLVAYLYRAGFPFRSVEGGHTLEGAALNYARARAYWALPMHQRIYRDLPFHPIWPGFAINTIFYATILWLLWATPFALRRRRRVKRGQCPACAYPIGTNPRCTECGFVLRRLTE